MGINRRNLVTGAVAAMAATSVTTAGAGEINSCGLPGKNLFYTKENPGHWESKVPTHVPILEIKGAKVKLITPHPMSQEHFIVRHTLLLAGGALVGAKTFTYADAPISEYDLPVGYQGKILGTSFCNQHDFWLVEATI